MSDRDFYVVMGLDGCVFRVGSEPSSDDFPPGAHLVLVQAPGVIGPSGAPVLWIDRVRSIREIASMMRDRDNLVPRPLSPQPVAVAGAVEIPPCPIGTVIEISDLSGVEVMAELVADADGWTETIEFPDPGEYRVSVAAPAPYLEASVRVVI